MIQDWEKTGDSFVPNPDVTSPRIKKADNPKQVRRTRQVAKSFFLNTSTKSSQSCIENTYQYTSYIIAM